MNAGPWMISLDKIKDLRREIHTFTRRTAYAAIVCGVLALLLLFRLADLQILREDYYHTRAEENRMRLSPVPPVRGLMLDRNGVLLAQNTPAFVLEIVPEQVKDMGALLGRLQVLLDLLPEEIERFKERMAKTPRYRSVPLRANLSMDQVARFQISRFDYAGADVSASLTRSYPLGAAAAHVIGYVGAINEDELKKIDVASYQGLLQIGKVGVEKSHEEALRGTPGTKIIEANAYGRPLRELEYRQGAAGRNLILTLDSQVQLVAEKALGELDGAVAAIDPRNGEVIALVSKPGFDPQLFTHGIDVKSYKALLEDPKRPLYNRVLQGAYPPGSTIKPFMALAGLETGALNPAEGVYCHGEISLPGSSRKYRCWKRQGHGWMDMKSGVMQSCDVYFYELARNLGIDRIHGFLDQFGLGHPTHIDLPLEKTGLLPSSEWKKRVRKERWYPGETLSVGIGQGYLTTTPMQLAQIAARMAMRGGGFEPHIVQAHQDALTGARRLVQPKALPVIANRHRNDWERVIDAMEDVAHTPGGTAFRVFKDAPYRAAGKTGTAQVAAMSQTELRARKLEETPFHLRDHALFIAFAPADDPRIAVAVIAEHAGHGGSAAAPIARQVMDQYLLGEILYPPPAPAPVATTKPAAASAAAAATATAEAESESPEAEEPQPEPEPTPLPALPSPAPAALPPVTPAALRLLPP